MRPALQGRPFPRHIAWISGLIGVAITEAIGIVAAIAPSLWLDLFSHDPNVLGPGRTYLAIVGLAYGLFGFGFVMSFAGQGAGRVLWPSVAVTDSCPSLGGPA